MAPTIDVGTLSDVDIIIFLLCLALSFAVAIWTAFKNKNTTQDFFTASNSMSAFPVAMSVVSTFTSSGGITGTAGEVYGHGLQISVNYVAGIIGMVIFTYTNLKVFYDLKITTVFEYLEIRYYSYALRVCMMILQSLHRVIAMGFIMYSPSLIIAAVTPLDLTTSIFIVGIVCALYSTIGGMRGVIWTDTFMMVVIFLGLITISILGFWNIGGTEIWKTASEGGRTKVFNFNPSLYQRQNFYYLVANGILVYGKQYGTTQVCLQRVLSCKSFEEYSKALIIIAVAFLSTKVLLLFTGLVAYATYVDCDPYSDGKIQKIDQILPYLINDQLSYMRGIPGLFLAALVCAAASSLSSIMNSISNVMYYDLLCKLNYFEDMSERVRLIICRTMTMLAAVPAIGFALLLTKTNSLLAMSYILYGIVNGPIFGIFFLGLLFPTSNLVGVLIGCITSMAVLAWMLIGNLLYKTEDEFLPLSTEACNSTAYNDTLWSFEDDIHSTSWTNQSLSGLHTNEPSVEKNIYDVSFAFYATFGTVICICVGLCASHLTGAEKAENVPEELITPVVRRFYYKSKETKETEEPQEINLDQNPNNKTYQISSKL